MAENMQKIKLIKLYEFLRKETDEDHPISRVELCKRLNEMGISSNVRTLSLDIEVLTSKLNNQELYLGGCCVSDNDPQFHCFECGKDFGKLHA